MSIRLYVEGGGDSKALRTECRRGFSEFLKKAGLAGRMPRVVACGGRRNAYDSFCAALAAGSTGPPMLVVDSEEPVTAAGPWEHVQARDQWARPSAATDDRCHLMVQCMEAWFLADRQSLTRYFGQDFREAALPANEQVEEIAKTDVLDGLKHATRVTQKGPYSKGKHGFDILAVLNPTMVEGAAPHARRLLEDLRRLAGKTT